MGRTFVFYSKFNIVIHLFSKTKLFHVHVVKEIHVLNQYIIFSEY